MLRTSIIRSVRSASCRTARNYSAITRPAIRSSFITRAQIAPVAVQSKRCYSAAGGLDKQQVEGRIIDLLANFDKVTDPTKLSTTANFTNDLGLDSLDTVEVVMAIEEEFSIEIPDKDADAIHSIDMAVNYILAQPDAH